MREFHWKRFFESPRFVYRVKGADEYRIITISLNPNTLKLYCNVYEEWGNHIDYATDNGSTDHNYHLPSDHILKKLDDSDGNRFLITKRIDVYDQIRRKKVCVSNSYDPKGDGNYKIFEELEVGKEYTVLPQTEISSGEFIYVEELPSAKGYPVSLFEEKMILENKMSNDVIFYNASAYMEYKGYKGTIEIDQEANILYGHLLIPNAIVGYDGAAPREFIQAFKDAVDDVIESP